MLLSYFIPSKERKTKHNNTSHVLSWATETVADRTAATIIRTTAAAIRLSFVSHCLSATAKTSMQCAHCVSLENKTGGRSNPIHVGPTRFSIPNCISIGIAVLGDRLYKKDRTARRQFQATGQPVSRTQASDAMTSRLPRYETKYVCNAGASNAGRSLCIQISRERSYTCQHIDTTQNAINCATTLMRTVFI